MPPESWAALETEWNALSARFQETAFWSESREIPQWREKIATHRKNAGAQKEREQIFARIREAVEKEDTLLRGKRKEIFERINRPSGKESELEKAMDAGDVYLAFGSILANVSSKGKIPKDWDVTTNAKPEEIQKVFPDSFYENNFLTVTVRTGAEKVPEIEITTYRHEAKYTDKRHPDEIKYAKTLEEDLSRRDFTINAMAMDEKKKVVDLFEGQKDLKNKIIRTVGNPEERFLEDALRIVK